MTQQDDRNSFDLITEEFLEDYHRGARPTIEQYVRKYPAASEQIRRIFPTLLLLEEAASGLDCDTQTTGGSLAHAPTDSIPQQLGGYRIIREIGRGGMGVVCEAEQLSLGRRVALKLIRTPQGDSKLVERFRRESATAASLQHTHIVPVFDVGCEAGYLYYAMQLIPGRPLNEVLVEVRRLGGTTDRHATQSGAVSRTTSVATSLLGGPSSSMLRPASEVDTTRISLDDSKKDVPTSDIALTSGAGSMSYAQNVATFGFQVCEALTYAHEHGVIHRDIKPANLLLDELGNAWVADFGLAKTEDSDLTDSGDVVGTLRYMAPERFKGRSDELSDIYGLGITLYEMLALRPAFEVSDRALLLQQISEVEPRRLRSIDKRIPGDLETIVSKAISKEPSRRYQTAHELGEDLQRFLERRPVLARPATSTDRLVSWCRRNPLPTKLLVVIAVLMVSFSVYQIASLFAPVVVTLRKLPATVPDLSGRISPDGRRVSFANWTTANIATHNLVSGETRDVTLSGTWEAPNAQYGESSVWSPDGKQLAYVWYTGTASEVRIISVDDEATRRTVYRHASALSLWTNCWSADGIHLVVYLRIRDGGSQLLLIDTQTEAVRVIKAFEGVIGSEGARISPDSRHVVFAQLESKDDPRRNIFLLDVETGMTTEVAAHQSNDTMPLFTPDGRWIVFVSDRRGTNGLWALRFDNGKGIGSPRLLYESLGEIDPLGFSQEGHYYFGQYFTDTDLYEASLDFESAAVLKSPKKIESRYTGKNVIGAWSPDGKQLAYLTRLDIPGANKIVSIRQQGGRERRLPLELPVSKLRPLFQWSDDSKLLYVRGMDYALREETLFSIQVDNGAIVPLPQSNQLSSHIAPWVTGGFVYSIDRAPTAINRVNQATGERQTIYKPPTSTSLTALEVSPDKTQIACVTNSLTTNDQRVVIIPIDSSISPRQLYSIPKGEASSHHTLAWSADSRFLLFGTHDSEGPQPLTTLWRIPVDGGPRKATGIVMPNLRHLRVHADGKRILFTADASAANTLLWRLENLQRSLATGD